MLDFLERELEEIQRQGLMREPRVFPPARGARVNIGGRDLTLFCTNDYLGLAGHPKLAEAARAAAEAYGVGAGASRLISGTTEFHRDLEQRLAAFKGEEAALVFPAGYMTNVGVLTALAGPGDAILLDRLVHASLVDAARLARARLRVYEHRDMNGLEHELRESQAQRRRFIVTDTVFSMDGDLAPLPDIVRLAANYHATVLADEAHATGVLGLTGRGAIEQFGLHGQVEVVIGTLSKALGSQGGFVTGRGSLIRYLVNRSRSYIYTTALAPPLCAAAMAALELVDAEPDRRARLWESARFLKSLLLKNGFDVLGSETPIMTVRIGEPERAVQAAHALWERGYVVPAIRPPSVPKGTSRLRISVSADHRQEDLEGLVEALADAVRPPR